MCNKVYQNGDDVMVRFRDKFTKSFRFSELFQEGMILVREVSTYLDEEGRVESRSLPRASAIAYAAESMRLTTQLMRLTSWLLLHHAVFEGAMPLEKARKEREKINFQDPFPAFRGEEVCGKLPDMLRRFIIRSDNFYYRVKTVDGLIYLAHEQTGEQENPVRTQVNRLRDLFSETVRRRRRKSDEREREGGR